MRNLENTEVSQLLMLLNMTVRPEVQRIARSLRQAKRPSMLALFNSNLLYRTNALQQEGRGDKEGVKCREKAVIGDGCMTREFGAVTRIW